MKIRMLKSVPASRDGMKVEEFQVDSIELIDESQPRALELGQMLVREGLAEIVTDEEAAAHVNGLAALSEPETAERAEFLKGLEVKDAEDRKLERTEKRQKKKKAAAPTPPRPAMVADAAAPPLEPKLEVGSVVLHADNLGQRMTITKLEGDTAECAWFVPGDGTPHSDLFVLASLIAAPIAES